MSHVMRKYYTPTGGRLAARWPACCHSLRSSLDCPELFLKLIFPPLLLADVCRKQKQGRLGAIDLHPAQGGELQAEGEHPVPHVHQHISLWGRPAQLSL